MFCVFSSGEARSFFAEGPAPEYGNFLQVFHCFFFRKNPLFRQPRRCPGKFLSVWLPDLCKPLQSFSALRSAVWRCVFRKLSVFFPSQITAVCGVAGRRSLPRQGLQASWPRTAPCCRKDPWVEQRYVCSQMLLYGFSHSRPVLQYR